MKRLIVVFGAAVRPDGSPSATLRRRAQIAARAALADSTAEIFCSGAVGTYPPSEAKVIASLLDGAVAPDRVHLDEVSRDTLQTVRAATAFARTHGFDACVACTDRYHQPRVRMLFALFGMPASSASGSVSDSGPWRYRAKMAVREAAALPYDFIAGLWAVRRSQRRPR